MDKKILTSTGLLLLTAILTMAEAVSAQELIEADIDPVQTQTQTMQRQETRQANMEQLKAKRQEQLQQKQNSPTAPGTAPILNSIDKKLNSLKELAARIQSMPNISAETKAKMLEQIKENIEKTTALKNGAGARGNATSTAAGIKRSKPMAIPQGYVVSSVDRVKTIAKRLSELAVKFQSRIDQAKAAGKDVKNLEEKMANLKAKIGEALSKAEEAQAAVVGLKPDESDAAKLKANKETIIKARNLIKTALQDIQKAQLDARYIAKTLSMVNSVNKNTKPEGTVVIPAQGE